MTETLTELVGSAAAVLTTVAFAPQAVKVIRTRETAAISLAMYALFTAGVALWFVYGHLIGSAPVIAANAITGLLAGAILVLKLRGSRPAQTQAETGDLTRPGPDAESARAAQRSL